MSLLHPSEARVEVMKDVAVVGAFALTAYLAPVLVSAVTNATELGVTGALELSLLTVVALWVGICCLLRLLRRPARRRLRGALVLLSAVCVANSSVFLWDFGLLDGTPIALEDHLPKALVELAFLAVAIPLFIRFRRAVDERIVGISVFLTLVAFAPLVDQARAVPRAARAYGADGALSFDFSDEDILSFSRGQNVLVFVIDAFETTHFLQSLKNNPRLAAAFTGFTLFQNNAGIAPNTTYSVPAMMSGIPYTGDQASDEYLATALLGPTSLPVVLRRHRYDVRIFTHNSIPYDPGVAAWDNVEEGGGRAAAIAGWLSLTRLGSYRVAPTPLKLLLRDQAGFARLQARVVRATGAAKMPLAEPFDDAGLLSRLARDAKPALSRPVLRWFHLQGIHEPFTLVPSAERSRLGMSRAQASQLQADRLLEKFADMLQAVRARGIYESATVVVIGDHGFDGRRRMPAMLIKPRESTTALVTSDAPTSNTDLPATVLAHAGIPSSPTGADAFSLDPNIPRARLFYEFYSVDQVTGRPKAIVTHVLTSRQNTAANWRSEPPRYPAFAGRETTTDFVGFTGNTFIDPRTVRGTYVRAVGGIHWSEWLEVDVAAPAGTPVLAEFLYYRYGSTPERVAISVDGAQRGEMNTSPFATLRLFLPAKSAPAGSRPHATVRFSFERSPAANETLLFVDLVSTRLSKDSPALQPAATGVNCDLNAVWGAGGEFWGTKPRILALVDTALFDVTVSEGPREYSFVVPAGALAKPITYRLLDPSTGAIGRELSPRATCPDS